MSMESVAFKNRLSFDFLINQVIGISLELKSGVLILVK